MGSFEKAFNDRCRSLASQRLGIDAKQITNLYVDVVDLFEKYDPTDLGNEVQLQIEFTIDGITRCIAFCFSHFHDMIHQLDKELLDEQAR